MCLCVGVFLKEKEALFAEVQFISMIYKVLLQSACKVCCKEVDFNVMMFDLVS